MKRINLIVSAVVVVVCIVLYLVNSKQQQAQERSLQTYRDSIFVLNHNINNLNAEKEQYEEHEKRIVKYIKQQYERKLTDEEVDNIIDAKRNR